MTSFCRKSLNRCNSFNSLNSTIPSLSSPTKSECKFPAMACKKIRKPISIKKTRCWFRKAQIKPLKLQPPHLHPDSSLFYEMSLPLTLLLSLVFSEREVNKTSFKEKTPLEVNEDVDLICDKVIIKEDVDLTCDEVLVEESNEQPEDTNSEKQSNDGNNGEYVFDEDQMDDDLETLQSSTSKYMSQMGSLDYQYQSLRTEVARRLLEFSKKEKMTRETLYSALNYFDRFLMVEQDLTQGQVLQAGWACLRLAWKKESRELFKKFSQEHESFGDVEVKDIYNLNECEISILKKLKFNLNPPHSIKWADVYMKEWDSFVMNSDKEFKTILFSKKKSKMSKMVFKILDSLIVEAESVEFEPQVMVIGAIFVALGVSVGQWSFEEIEIIIKEKQWEQLTKCRFAEFFMGWVDFKEIVPFFEFFGWAALDCMRECCMA